MKRIEQPVLFTKRYKDWIIFWILPFIIMMILWLVFGWIISIVNSKWIDCTPSEENQQITQRLESIENKLDKRYIQCDNIETRTDDWVAVKNVDYCNFMKNKWTIDIDCEKSCIKQ